MKITKQWLQTNNACGTAIILFRKRYKSIDAITLLEVLIEEERFDWTVWLLYHVMNSNQYTQYIKYSNDITSKFYGANIDIRLGCDPTIALTILQNGIKILKEVV